MKLDIYRNNDYKFNDAFDQAVMNIHIQKERKGYKTFTICGCEPGDGTTTVAINLAASLASSGWNTVLVDGDMRKKNKFKRLNEETSVGLSNYLNDQVKINEIIYETSTELLSYIPSGDLIDNPVRLLCSTKMVEAKKALEDEFDFVIYDMPALNAAMDANVMAVKSDACILVVASGETSKKGLAEAVNQLQEEEANLLGVIINKLDKDQYKRYRKDFDYFKKERYAENAKSAIKSKKKRIKNICLGFALACGMLFSHATVSEAAEISGADSAVIDIENYEVEEGALNPGEQVTLKFKIKNNSTVTPAENAVMTFEPLDGVLAPVYGEDNQVYIGSVPAGESVDVVLSAVVNQKFNADSAQMKCYFNYVSGVVALSNTVAISIPANASSNLLAESVIVSENATVGANSLVSLRYKNAGTATISDAKLIVTGNVQDESKEIALASVAAGQTVSEDYYVNFTESGIQSLQLACQYTDAKGDICMIDLGEYKVSVADSQANASYNVYVTKVNNTNNQVLQIILLCGVACISAGVIIRYLKGRR